MVVDAAAGVSLTLQGGQRPFLFADLPRRGGAATMAADPSRDGSTLDVRREPGGNALGRKGPTLEPNP